MKRKLIITAIFSCLIFSLLQAKDFKQIILKLRDAPINRELVMAPEVWYDTESHEIDVYMHSAGVLIVYFADGETVHSVNNLTFDLNKVFCDKECNLIILETTDGIVYEGYLQGEMK